MKRKGFLGGIFAMALILVLTLVLSVGSVSAAEPTIVDSGNCGANGDNITWTLDDAGTLTISGEGEMGKFQYSGDYPWLNRMNEIKAVRIGNAGIYSTSVPLVLLMDGTNNAGIASRIGIGNLRGAVLRTVIDQKDLDAAASGKQTFDTFFHITFRIIAGNSDC